MTCLRTRFLDLLLKPETGDQAGAHVEDKIRDAAFALHRFGLGPRPGSIAAIAADPRGALLAELDRPGAGRIDDPRLLTSAQSSRAGFEARSARQAKQIVESVPESRPSRRKPKAWPWARRHEAGHPKPAAAPRRRRRRIEQQNFLKEVRARLDAALVPEIGLPERLVWFWSNHFCVSGFVVPNMTGGYEREAIRPHILGRFVDMLLTTEGHPAMLVYLNNTVSIGPNSVAGINRTRGLNENLAREILELHTLGVRTGYTQDDVIRFANVLTGWTILPPATIIPSTAPSSCSMRACMSPVHSGSSTRTILTRAWSRVAPCWPIWRAIPLPRPMSPPSSLAILLLIRRRSR